MIPCKLIVKNFLSYGPSPQTIKFENESLICLSGNNGHGKSALLEAITWALWGFARKVHGTVKNDRDLVHIGTNEMLICFEFTVHSTRYIVRRSCSATPKKITTELVFGICNENGIIQKSLTESSQKQTQLLVNKIIGLDYETFINSVYIRQGLSNEFSKKSPKERKEILCNILQINKIEEIRIKALEDQKNLKSILLAEQSHQETLRKNLISKEYLCSWEEKIKNTKDNYINKKKLLDKQHTDILNLTKEIETQQKLLELTHQKYKENVEKKNIIYKKLQSLREIYKICKKYQDNQNSSLESTYNKIHVLYTSIKQSENIYTTLLQEAKKLKEKLYTAASKDVLALKKEETKELHKHEKIQSDILLLSSKQNSLQAEIKILNDLQKEQTEEINYYNKKLLYKPFYQNYINRLTKLDQKINKSREKHIHLQDAVPFLQKESINKQQCLVCHQKVIYIASNKKKTPISKWANRLSYAQKHLESCKNKYLQLELYDQKLKNLQIVLDQNKAKNKLYTEELHKITHSSKTHQELFAKSGTALKSIRLLLEETHNKIIQEEYLKNDSYKTVLQKIDLYRSAQITSSSKDLGIAHTFLKKTIENNTYYSLLDIYKKLKSLCKIARFYYNDSSEEEIKKQKKLTQKLHSLQADYQSNESSLQHIYQEVTEDYAMYKNTKQQAEFYNEQIKQIEVKIKQNSKELQNLQDFCHILGKDGLQASLIEEIIPEIEYEANTVLTRLTDNGSSVSIESIKDLKSGKIKETLDIMVTDSTGTRAYELFSGGEAFRIDLSIRIALSKILSKKAGVELHLLIIDEGFGSQDGVALDAIINTIHQLKDEFKMIIIVSHLQTLKDQFPTQLLVKKTAHGSIVEYMHNS